jgi:RNA polymerase sigma-70 factor (ECF subfamily)
MTEPASHSPFPTTHWSRVVAAGDRDAQGAREALAALCADYWYPLYAFARRKGFHPDEAADIVQEYILRLIDGDVLAAADPVKGRFRSFLLTDCGSHILNAIS